eukprot:CAMPEP_0170317692 /NCGR_PEP_ID=MMETSP0116_2-20130129/59522_1 /TAXON_ID=400756 /ORGANISM="Durinskia baltica, Strain CSIRO CS-38" /LENGTH=92 /DNA_ID=CAMNT_0010570347 /DNA_START=25 /DNA_END=300 /DNA_ORIENTATION=+
MREFEPGGAPPRARLAQAPESPRLQTMPPTPPCAEPHARRPIAELIMAPPGIPTHSGAEGPTLCRGRARNKAPAGEARSNDNKTCGPQRAAS